MSAGNCALYFAYVPDGNWIDPVVLSRLEQLDVAVFILDGQVRDLADLHARCVPVVRVLRQHELAVDLPFLQLVRPVAHELAGLGPVLAVFFDRGLVDGPKRRVRHQFRQERHRIRRLHLERVRVDGAHAEFRHRLLARDDVRAVQQELAEGGRRSGRQFRIDEAPGAVDEIVCGEGLAIGPFGVLAQMEDPGGRVLLFPLLGDARLDVAVRIGRGDAFEKILRHVVRRHRFHEVRVERLDFRRVVAHEFLFGRQLHARRDIGRVGADGEGAERGGERRRHGAAARSQAV